jgi:hypothetical protein
VPFVPPRWLLKAIDAVFCVLSFGLGAINVYCWRGLRDIIKLIPREPGAPIMAGVLLFGASVALVNAVRAMRKARPRWGRVAWLGGILIFGYGTAFVYLVHLWALGIGPPI